MVPGEDFPELMSLVANYPGLRQPRPIRIEEPVPYVYDDYYYTPAKPRGGEIEMVPLKLERDLELLNLFDLFEPSTWFKTDYTKKCEDWNSWITEANTEFGNAR